MNKSKRILKERTAGGALFPGFAFSGFVSSLDGMARRTLRRHCGHMLTAVALPLFGRGVKGSLSRQPLAASVRRAADLSRRADMQTSARSATRSSATYVREPPKPPNN
eukprot:3816338-Amphidinium_carterae.1